YGLFAISLPDSGDKNPPTSDKLTWKDYQKVTEQISGKYDAITFWKRQWNIEYSINGNEDKMGGLFNATVEVKLTSLKYSVQFDPSKYKVVKGKESNRLLEHEKLHLRMAEYIAKKRQPKSAPNIVGKGVAANADVGVAAKMAQERATTDLKGRVEKYV